MAGHFSGGDIKTPAKLKLLEWYLERYVPIMENNWSSYWYIDTHAGTGKTECETGAIIDGSTIRVLDEYANKFDRFYFYELQGDHFHTLHETLADRFDYDFRVTAPFGDRDFYTAKHNDPYIRIMQMDSNRGVQWLADKASTDPHWFSFIDPKGLTVKRDTLDHLIGRGHMDLLINYQTTGVMRNAAPDAAQDAVARTMGDDDWPVDGDPDDYVEEFEKRLSTNPEWQILSKKLEDPRQSSYRFDMVFACASEIGIDIMNGAMTRDDLWDAAYDEFGQSGLGAF